jgi:rRNA-processing protein FCF1
MQPLRLRLKPGAIPEQAITALDGRITAAKNLRGEISRPGLSPAAEADYMMRRRDAYVEWAEATEVALSNLTDDADVLGMVYTAAHAEIRRLIPTDPRPVPLIDSETTRQVANLEWLRDDLAQRRERALSASGHLTLLDTNVLMHYQPPANINWPELVAKREVRLVIPLAVIDELDAMKFSDSARKRGKARELLPQLRCYIGHGGTPQQVRDHTTIEVLIEPGPRGRAIDVDSEILETAHELRRLSGQPVTIVTADTGMSLRAEGQGLPIVMIPDEYRRD